MRKIFLFMFNFLLLNILLYSNILKYPIYSPSLGLYSHVDFEKWSKNGNIMKGLVLKVPKNTIEIDVLVLGVGTKVTAYEYSLNNGHLNLIKKLGSATTPVNDWTKIKIPKLEKDTNVYLEFDFSNAKGYAKGVVVSNKLFKDFYVKPLMYNQNGGYYYTFEPEWHATPFGKAIDVSNLTIRPYIRFIKE